MRPPNYKAFCGIVRDTVKRRSAPQAALRAACGTIWNYRSADTLSAIILVYQTHKDNLIFAVTCSAFYFTRISPLTARKAARPFVPGVHKIAP